MVYKQLGAQDRYYFVCGLVGYDHFTKIKVSNYYERLIYNWWFNTFATSFWNILGFQFYKGSIGLVFWES